MEKFCCTHVYYGDGKGKTTAAIGMAVRAAGAGMKVWFVQFMKGRASSEIEILKVIPSVTVVRNSRDFGFYKNMSQADILAITRMHNRSLENIKKAMEQASMDMLILDEILSAYEHRLIDRGQVLSILKEEKNMEIVLTGRRPSAVFLESADYITRMSCVRHPYEKGKQARKGIEW